MLYTHLNIIDLKTFFPVLFEIYKLVAENSTLVATIPKSSSDSSLLWVQESGQ